MEKTFRALHYQKCGKSFQEKSENHGTLATKTHIFLVLS